MKVIVFRRHGGHHFIEIILEAFKRLGHEVLFLDSQNIKDYSVLNIEIDRFLPDFIFSLTANSNLSQSIRPQIPFIHYELDKVMNEKLLKPGSFSPRDFIFTTYKNDVKRFENSGAGISEYLPFFYNARAPQSQASKISRFFHRDFRFSK